MTATLGDPAWMRAPETRAVIAALEAGGYAGCARFVGGAVRNTLMGRPVDDVDIATVLTPDAVTQALEAAGLRAVPTGLDHGTVTGIANHTPFEITTLRRDVDTDGRHAVVAFTHDWAEDAQRRDFRFNALYADPSGQIYDPTGYGVEDARTGQVVFVGDAMVRLREDYLRILRFFRFYAWYGLGEPNTAAVEACKTLRGMLGAGTAERMQKELLKLLAAPDPRSALSLMVQTGVLAEVLPQAKPLDQINQLIAIDAEQRFPADAELRLAALCMANVDGVESVAARLRLSNATRNRLLRAIAAEPEVMPQMSPRAVRAAVWRLGSQAFCDGVRLAWARADTLGSAQQWTALIALAQSWMRPQLPVGGEDAMAAGAPRGQAIGQALADVEAWWISEDFPDSREKALAMLKQIAARIRAT